MLSVQYVTRTFTGPCAIWNNTYDDDDDDGDDDDDSNNSNKEQ
jgi:hypothetical protein